MRAVIDTGVLVSGLIRRGGTTGEVLHALRNNRFKLLYSTPIIIEIIEVLDRPQFRNKYHIQPDDISALINLIRLRGDLVIINQKIDICRDPNDNKFIEAAVEGNANYIVTGDNDLLVLNPYHGIHIIRPVEFLAAL